MVIQEPQLEKFLADERIAAYAKQGKVTFIIRNPGMEYMRTHLCIDIHMRIRVHMHTSSHTISILTYTCTYTLGNPEPILMSPHRKIDCYWQQYTENLALLRHWQEDVRMFFMDSDEFIVFNENLTKQVE
ncbi:hypothetical protein EON63_01650 [archaeon]|nr:MAG: hypothetical protein EON63_01650 [archaeon]